MLVQSAHVSGRVLMNPSENVNTTLPRIEFIEEVVAMVSGMKESGDEAALVEAFNTVRMYHLCSPNTARVEPAPGTEKVRSIAIKV